MRNTPPFQEGLVPPVAAVTPQNEHRAAREGTDGPEAYEPRGREQKRRIVEALAVVVKEAIPDRVLVVGVVDGLVMIRQLGVREERRVVRIGYIERYGDVHERLEELALGDGECILRDAVEH